ncbi:MAG: ABC transporter ATP-binding protein [Acidobacteria bacterium]|jgi:sodium transport system ATP-binding protein|nr:ABC transporter ATP-binding protein [Acidobacteriota bacterium]
MTHPVEVTDLVKIYYDEGRGEVRAVDGVSFSVARGEIFGLLGPNGAGKTTTLRTLATVLTPTSGRAAVMGHDVVQAPTAVRRSIGYLSTSTALYPRLSARETLEFFARINGYPQERIAARVDGLIERFGLDSYARARVEKLSTGMKQKVSIARAIVHDPPVLVFDEPTVGLDVINAHELQQLIRALREEGKTILFSTHIMSEAEKLCDRIGIIQGGRILACDTLQALRAATGLHYLEDIFLHYARPAA